VTGKTRCLPGEGGNTLVLQSVGHQSQDKSIWHEQAQEGTGLFICFTSWQLNKPVPSWACSCQRMPVLTVRAGDHTLLLFVSACRDQTSAGSCSGHDLCRQPLCCNKAHGAVEEEGL
jgi:hypothetical protein